MKRRADLPDDAGGGPQLQGSKIEEGWKVFERWATRFHALAAVEEKYAFALSTRNDIEMSLWDEMVDDPAQSQEMAWRQGNGASRRVKDKIAFLRDYFAYISFDPGDFHMKVKTLLKYQSPKLCINGYGFWFNQFDISTAVWPYNIHFSGCEVNLFCEDYETIDFGGVMGICPFDVLLVRNRGGADWTHRQVTHFKKSLRADLAHDGITVRMTKVWTAKDVGHPMLAIRLPVTAPKGVYFDYSVSDENASQLPLS